MHSFCTGVTDRWIGRWTDVFLADASKKRRHKQKTNGTNKTTYRLLEWHITQLRIQSDNALKKSLLFSAEELYGKCA